MSAAIETNDVTPLQWIAVGLAAITGVIHLVLGVQFFPGAQPVSFLLAGLGFFGGIVLFLRNYRRQQLYVGGAGFTLLQIVLYLWLNQRVQPAISPIEAIDKAAQILLIASLVVLYQRGQ
ncbi:MAG: hypothetical protein ABEI27_03200 [Halobellus sp.]|uniref:DUF7475 family protein n=1 Tax=Halobellus sp. TaxID=1979212 RepID=UPI0035D3F683